MKCMILAGGKGERLWPLSRANYPKQFIRIRENHSVFQETVARNIPFCDEFIIVTGSDYKDIIANQMEVFQGVPYRVILEDVPRRTLTSVVLASLDLVPSEFVFAVASDILIDASEAYRDAIVSAKQKAGEGRICALCKAETSFMPRYGYIYSKDGKYVFKEKPETPPAGDGELYRNLGMTVFRVGDFLKEASKFAPDHFAMCSKANRGALRKGENVRYSEELLKDIEALSIERSILEKTELLEPVISGFEWKELTSLEDLEALSYNNMGLCIVKDSDSVVINDSPLRALVVDGIDDAVIVNTDDAVYVGRKGSRASTDMKSILGGEPQLRPFLAKSMKYYRHWGYYEQIAEGTDYHVRKVSVMPGRTIFAHSHDNREENWTILSGKASVTIGDKTCEYTTQTNINIPVGTVHRISNTGDDMLIFIDTSFGESLHNEELLPGVRGKDLFDTVGRASADKLIKLRPAFKDSLWGGTALRDRYGMNCDYDRIAEAWIMSAHPSGESIVDSGRSRGMKLSSYIENSGRAILGWKCSPLKAFPLLVKFIDARDDLSVQVHPDDDYALENEGQYGKNEMWYIIDAAEGAGLYIGFKRDVTQEEVRSAVADGTMSELLNFYPTKPGDLFMIPAGTVHAIGGGNLICEVQQSSDLTYRLYDFDRKDEFGNRRELHLEKALAVADLHKYVPSSHIDGDTCKCKYFESTVIEVKGESVLIPDDSKFSAIICLKGSGTVSEEDEELPVKEGECIFRTASPSALKLRGDMTVMVTSI